MAELRIGTSGWHYASWRGPFYPREVTIKRQLAFYASVFSTTELNGVFYRTPTEAAVRAWREQTPRDFVFAWKASKFITHWKRLSPRAQSSLALLESRVKLLGAKAGPVLFQLPPQLAIDANRLGAFLKMLNRRRRYVFEFRHPSWYTSGIFRLLADANVALCISDHADAPAPWKRTADFVYVRGHGPGGRYAGNYTRAALEEWCGRIVRLLSTGHDVFVFFDNDQKSAAPRDAQRLAEMAGRGRRRRSSNRDDTASRSSEIRGMRFEP
jgi:uncharacterized protein YecE (DUF72 family)